MLTILLDLDGTLINTDEILNQIYSLLEKYRLSKDNFDRLYEQSKKEGRPNLQNIFNQLASYLDETQQTQFLQEGGSLLEKPPPLIDGARELVDFLKTQPNLRLYIFTQGDEETQRQKLISSGLLTEEEVDRYLKAYSDDKRNHFKEFTNEGTVVIDDKLEVVRAAKKEGIVPLWHCAGRHNEQYLQSPTNVETPNNIKEVIKEKTGITPFFTLNEVKQQLENLLKES